MSIAYQVQKAWFFEIATSVELKSHACIQRKQIQDCGAKSKLPYVHDAQS